MISKVLSRLDTEDNFTETLVCFKVDCLLREVQVFKGATDEQKHSY